MRHPVDYAPSQDFGDNPTSVLPASHWIIKQFGNYQPDGHTGTDYPCPVGTPVRAAADGTVVHVGYYTGTYADNPYWISPGFAGFCYVVDHGSFIGIYGHCMDGGARVRVNQKVIEGQVLGLSGNTGASTGPHLHFEVLPDGYVLNSYMYGRINPATLFGSAAIAPQGDITVQEDSLSAAEVQQILNHIDNTSMADRLWMQADNEARELVTRKDVVRQIVTALSDKIDGASLDMKMWEQGDNEARHLATRKEVDEAREAILATLRAEQDAGK